MSVRRTVRPPSLCCSAVVLCYAVCCAVCCAAMAAPAAAQSLTLDRVIETTLAQSAAITIGAQQVAIGRGALTAAAGAFDFQFGSTVARQHSNPFIATSKGLVPLPSEQTTYTVAGARQSRLGLVLTPQLSVTQVNAGETPAMNQSSFQVSVLVPLARDRLGASVSAPERAATADYAAAELDQRYTIDQSLTDAVNAYWDYVAAQRNLDVYRASEERARLTVRETEALVKAEERTPAELKQLEASLAARTVNRITAEQAVVDARRRLGVLMGLRPETIAALDTGATDFPDVVSVDTIAIAALSAVPALARRADLSAAVQREQSAQRSLDGAESDTRPRVDLVATLGYAGLISGNGFGQTFSPLYRNVPGMNATVQLSYQMPAANDLARGRALQLDALLAQRRIAREQLARSIGAGVAVGVSAVLQARRGLDEVERAVVLAGNGIAAEKAMYQVGSATLFEVVQAEDALTNALLSRIALQRSLAQALATLRLQLGVVMPEAGAGGGVTGTVASPALLARRFTTTP